MVSGGKVRVLENSFLYSVSSLLVKSMGFLLLPVYTLFLTPDDYGITNLMSSFSQVATFIIAFSLYSAIIRFYTDYKDDRAALKRLYGTVIIFVSVSGIVFIILGFIFRYQLISLFFSGISFYPVIAITLLTLVFVCLHTIHQSILQGMQQGKKLTTINLSVFTIEACLNLLLIGVFKFGAVGVLVSRLIVNILYFLYMSIDLKRNDLVQFCVDFKLLKEILLYSIPLMPHDMSTHIASFVSRIFINNNGTLASVGLYGVASQFGAIVDLIQSSVNRAFSPWFYEKMNTNNEGDRREILGLSRLLLIMYSLLYMVISMFSQEVIILLTNDKYFMAWTAIPIFVVGYSIKSIYYNYINILFYFKEAARKIFISTIISSIANIVLSFALIPQYDMYGAAVSFMIAKIIVVTIVVRLSRKHNNIGYRYTEMLSIIVPSLLFMAVGLYFSYTKYTIVFSWFNLFYKLIILCLYIVFLFVTNRKLINKVVYSQYIKHILRRNI